VIILVAALLIGATVASGIVGWVAILLAAMLVAGGFWAFRSYQRTL
jgi:hypothetical protein